MTPEQKDALLEIMKGHVSRMMEHFDTVQVFCTQVDSDNKTTTTTYRWGAGNWYARYGQVKEWTTYEEQLKNSNDKEQDQ